VHLVLIPEKRNFFFMVPGGTPGAKIMNVVFRGIKLKKVIKNDPLFKPDINKSILIWAEKWPYPPSSFGPLSKFAAKIRIE
jgi:hypothetical protein